MLQNVEFLKSVFPKLQIESSQDIKNEITETLNDIELGTSQILELVRNIKGLLEMRKKAKHFT